MEDLRHRLSEMVLMMSSKFRWILLITIIGIILFSCTKDTEDQNNKPNQEDKEMAVNKQEALRIANEDAKSITGPFSIYDVIIELEHSNWKIDYELKDKNAQGGGPHYLISHETGEIISRRFEQ